LRGKLLELAALVAIRIGSCGVKKVCSPLASGAGWFLPVFLCGAFGCGGESPKATIGIPAAHNNLRNLSIAYMQATTELKRGPKSAEELKPFATKAGFDIKEIVNSPIDGAELVIQWGVDPRNLKSQDGKYPIWVYEKNPHSGKRWVLQGKSPVEMSEDELKNSPLAPGMKKP